MVNKTNYCINTKMLSRSISYIGITMVHMATFNKAKAAKSGGRIGGRNVGFKANKINNEKNNHNQINQKQITQQNNVQQHAYIIPPAPLPPIFTYTHYNPLDPGPYIFIVALLIAILSSPFKKK